MWWATRNRNRDAFGCSATNHEIRGCAATNLENAGCPSAGPSGFGAGAGTGKNRLIGFAWKTLTVGAKNREPVTFPISAGVARP